MLVLFYEYLVCAFFFFFLYGFYFSSLLYFSFNVRFAIGISFSSLSIYIYICKNSTTTVKQTMANGMSYQLSVQSYFLFCKKKNPKHHSSRLDDVIVLHRLCLVFQCVTTTHTRENMSNNQSTVCVRSMSFNEKRPTSALTLSIAHCTGLNVCLSV